ncbi:deoxyuridine 5'-triphosphate nucleotidohydrolase [Halorutilales archaeon Cl-col2-1]
MIRSGSFVADHIEPADSTDFDEAIQPNGFDLSIREIYRHETRATLTDDDYDKPDRRRIETEERDGGEFYSLEPGSYVVEYAEVVEIPENHVGFVYPRSRLMRSGGMLFTAVWDSGYKGRGEGGLRIDVPMEIQADMRICQIVFEKTEKLSETYSGSHQNENLD